MRIEDHARMWLKVQIYEEQMPMVSRQMVEATIDACPVRHSMVRSRLSIHTWITWRAPPLFA